MADYISREAAKEFFLNMDAGSRSPYATLLTPEEFAEYLDEIPAADVEPVRHGEWLLRHIGHGHYWECSVCHTNPCIYVTEHTKFCPNCGAKMDLEDEQ